MRYINEYEYKGYFILLILLAGVSKYLGMQVAKGSGDDYSLQRILIYSIIFGGVLGGIGFYIGAAVINWVSKLFSGKGDLDSIFRVSIYASIPSIISLLLIIFQIAIYGNEVFKSDVSYLNENTYLYITILVLDFVLLVYTFVLLVIGVSEVQKFGVLKSIISVLLGSFIINIPFLILLVYLN